VGKPADELLPEQLTIPNLAAAAEDCEACDLHARATQTVFGEGGAPSTVMLVGEQPGDREDVEGRPFVGPAGRFLDSALEAAGIDRKRVYVTNIVKHFKWVARGKRRIHQSPNQTEVLACRPWLQAEILVVKPKVIVALGATAAKAHWAGAGSLKCRAWEPRWWPLCTRPPFCARRIGKPGRPPSSPT